MGQLRILGVGQGLQALSDEFQGSQTGGTENPEGVSALVNFNVLITLVLDDHQTRKADVGNIPSYDLVELLDLLLVHVSLEVGVFFYNHAKDV